MGMEENSRYECAAVYTMPAGSGRLILGLNVTWGLCDDEEPLYDLWERPCCVARPVIIHQCQHHNAILVWQAVSIRQSESGEIGA